MIQKNNKGFTLMEMLIVVAIVAILISIAIPVLAKNLEKTREAADLANLRTAYAMVMAAYIDDSGTSPNAFRTSGPYDAESNEKYLGTTEVVKAKKSNKTYDYKMFVWVTQKTKGWQGKANSVAGINVPFTNAALPLYKIVVNSATGQAVITQTDFKGVLKN